MLMWTWLVNWKHIYMVFTVNNERYSAIPCKWGFFFFGYTMHGRCASYFVNLMPKSKPERHVYHTRSISRMHCIIKTNEQFAWDCDVASVVKQNAELKMWPPSHAPYATWFGSIKTPEWLICQLFLICFVHILAYFFPVCKYGEEGTLGFFKTPITR